MTHSNAFDIVYIEAGSGALNVHYANGWRLSIPYAWYQGIRA